MTTTPTPPVSSRTIPKSAAPIRSRSTNPLSVMSMIASQRASLPAYTTSRTIACCRTVSTSRPLTAISVVGDAFKDPAFTAGTHRVRYSAPLGTASGPFTVEAELWYQPIGFRWANNLKPYNSADEPRRFNTYFDSMQSATGALLAHAMIGASRDN